MLDSEKRETVVALSQMHRAEIQHHEIMAGNVFNWTSALLVGIGSAFLLVSTSNLWEKSFSFTHKFVLRLLVMSLAWAIGKSARKQILSRYLAANENARLVARLARLLDLFENGFYGSADEVSLYQQGWLDWGAERRQATKFSDDTYNFILHLLAIFVYVTAATA